MKKNLGIIAVIAILGLFLAAYAKKSLLSSKLEADPTESTSKTESDSAQDRESYPVEFKNIDDYYEQNSEVVSVVAVNSSEEVQTEKEVVLDFEDRGFSEIPIFTEYSIDGTFHEEKEISDVSNDRHPKYKAYYITEKEELWTIIWINGKIMANPVSYNHQSTLPAQLVISETETINGYDNRTGKFYETIPKTNALIVKTVDHIDKDLLEKLTIEEIDKL